MTEPKTNDSGPRKGIYLLPNLLTTGGLFSGFFAIVASMNGRFEAAAVAICIALGTYFVAYLYFEARY